MCVHDAKSIEMLLLPLLLKKTIDLLCDATMAEVVVRRFDVLDVFLLSRRLCFESLNEVTTLDHDAHPI